MTNPYIYCAPTKPTEPKLIKLTSAVSDNLSYYIRVDLDPVVYVGEVAGGKMGNTTLITRSGKEYTSGNDIEEVVKMLGWEEEI